MFFKRKKISLTDKQINFLIAECEKSGKLDLEEAVFLIDSDLSLLKKRKMIIKDLPKYLDFDECACGTKVFYPKAK